MYGLPSYIKNEKDLDAYDDFLNAAKHTSREKADAAYSTSKITEGLREFIGKPIKIELLSGGCLSARCGILTDVKNNIVFLRQPQSGNMLLCDTQNIGYVTILKRLR